MACDVHGGSVVAMKIVLIAGMDGDWNMEPHHFQTDTSVSSKKHEPLLVDVRNYLHLLILQRKRNSLPFFNIEKKPKNKINKGIYSNSFFRRVRSLSLSFSFSHLSTIPYKKNRLSIFLKKSLYFFLAHTQSMHADSFSGISIQKCSVQSSSKKIYIGWISWLCLGFKISIWVFRLSFG